MTGRRWFVARWWAVSKMLGYNVARRLPVPPWMRRRKPVNVQLLPYAVKALDIN